MSHRERIAGLVLILIACELSACASPKTGQDHGPPASIMREVKDQTLLPSGTYVMVRKWQAEEAQSNTGRVVDDPDAAGGRALEARVGVDKPQTLLFGPYIEIDPGAYVAFFRLKLLDHPDQDEIATLDACVNYANTMLAWRPLFTSDLVPDRYVEVPLAFRYSRGKLECRVTWPGTADLRVDTVTLFKVEGTNLSEFIGRAEPAKPSGEPKNLPFYTEPRPFPDVFPQSPAPAPELVVVDLRSEGGPVRFLAA